MTDATPRMIAMARRIVADQYQRIRDHDYARWVLDGLKDETQGVKIALAAIIETQRLDAAIADRHGNNHGQGPYEFAFAKGKNMAADNIAAAIRAGKHYGKDTDQ